MRFFEFCSDDPNDRKPNLSLRHIHTLKQVHQKRRDEFATRKKLMGLMYGRNDEALVRTGEAMAEE